VSAFLEALAAGVIVGDGAMGTEIEARGVPAGRSYDGLNLTQPELIRAVHWAYIAAGAGLIETNTFTANRPRLRRFGLDGRTREINVAAAGIARDAAAGRAFVAGSVGPLTGLPGGEEKRDVFREQCDALAEGGCDALILETFTDLDELRIALGAAKATGLPVVCQRAEAEVPGLAAEGADVVGVNCIAPDDAVRAVEAFAGRGRASVSAFPSAGPPGARVAPEAFAAAGERLIGLGARLVGGCCGTGPEHIRALARRCRP
jgi:homocysteine S-methyltransferase